MLNCQKYNGIFYFITYLMKITMNNEGEILWSASQYKTRSTSANMPMNPTIYTIKLGLKLFSQFSFFGMNMINAT